MKTFMAALSAAAVLAPVPAMAFDELPEDDVLWEQAPRFLPNSSVAQPALMPDEASALEPVLARALGVRRTVFSASYAMSVGRDRSRAMTYTWEDQRAAAQLLRVQRPSVSRYIAGENRHLRLLRESGVIVARSSGTKVYFPLGGKRLATAQVPGSGPAALRRAVRAVRTIERRAQAVPSAYRKYLRANATTLMAWTYVALFNELPKYLPDEQVQDFPSDPQTLFDVQAGLGGAGDNPTVFSRLRDGGDNCMEVEPRNGGTSAVVHMTFDTRFGGKAKVLSLDPGPCPAPQLAAPPVVSIARPPAAPPEAAAIGQWLGQVTRTGPWRYSDPVTMELVTAGEPASVSVWRKGRRLTATIYTLGAQAASTATSPLQAYRSGRIWIATGPAGAHAGATVFLPAKSKREALAALRGFVQRARTFPQTRRDFELQYATQSAALRIARFSSQARFQDYPAGVQDIVNVPNMKDISLIAGSGPCVTVRATAGPSQPVAVTLNPDPGMHSVVTAVSAGTCA